MKYRLQRAIYKEYHYDIRSKKYFWKEKNKLREKERTKYKTDQPRQYLIRKGEQKKALEWGWMRSGTAGGV